MRENTIYRLFGHQNRMKLNFTRRWISSVTRVVLPMQVFTLRQTSFLTRFSSTSVSPASPPWKFLIILRFHWSHCAFSVGLTVIFLTTMLLPTYHCVKSAAIRAANLRRRGEKLLLPRNLKNFETQSSALNF